MDQTENWSEISWKELQKRLDNDSELFANIEFARRIVNNYETVVNYYLGKMSIKIIQRINKLMNQDSYAEYYIYLSSPFNEETQSAEWHKVSLYKALNDCTLKTYTSSISCRHFYKLANKEKKMKNSETELLEYKDYDALLMCDQAESDDDDIRLKWMKKAFQALKERDQLILQYLVIEKIPSIEAYDKLEHLIHPIPKDGKTSDEVKASWDIKRRQDAISLMKGYALDRLLKNYKKQKRNEI